MTCKHTKHSIYTMLLMLLMLGCDSSRIYEDYVDMPHSFWHKDSLQSFPFEIQDTARVNIHATFRNASRYPFYNLYFEYTLRDSTGSILKKQLKEHLLFESKTGKPLGSGLGDLFDHTVPLASGYRFEQPGTYTLELQQFMRVDSLPFILSVGARVERVE